MRREGEGKKGETSKVKKKVLAFPAKPESRSSVKKGAGRREGSQEEKNQGDQTRRGVSSELGTTGHAETQRGKKDRIPQLKKKGE